MALLKRGKARRLVLDIGTSSIRLCELAPTKQGYQLVRYHQRDLDIDPTMDEEEKLERKQEVLQTLLKEVKIRAKKTVTAVPGQSVFTRNRPLPPVPEYKVTQIVKYEIQQQIPFSLDQIALDYQVLGRTEAGGYDVMMAAIKVDVVEKQLEILRKVKKNIEVVDVSPIAAYNWLRHTGEFGEDGQCIALLDLGATTTDIVIQKDNQFKFTRSLHVGGNDITASIASNFNMAYHDAERLKRDKGFAPTGDTKRDGRGGEVIGQALNRLVGEVNRSFAYFRSQPGGGPINRVIVTGGGACLRNIIPYLQRQLGIEVRIAQPLAGIAVSPKANEASEHPEQACVALGLALRCCETVPIQINLIPPRVLEVARRKEQVFYWVLSLATMYLILASSIPFTAAKNEQVELRIKELQNVIAQYDPSLMNDPGKQSLYETDFDIVNRDIQGFQGDVKELDKHKKYRDFWLPYIKAITDSRPSSPDLGTVAISSLETIVIGGSANTGSRFRTGGVGAQKNTKKSQDKPKEKNTSGFGSGDTSALFNAMQNVESTGKKEATLTLAGFPGIFPHKVVEPNGFTLYGFATDVDTVRQFVENLKEQEVFVEGGVYWDIGFSEFTSESDLDDAKLGGGGSRAAAGGSSGSSSGGSDFSGFGNTSTGSSPSRNSAGFAGPEVLKFHIEVQFLGKPQKNMHK